MRRFHFLEKFDLVKIAVVLSNIDRAKVGVSRSGGLSKMSHRLSNLSQEEFGFSVTERNDPK